MTPSALRHISVADHYTRLALAAYRHRHNDLFSILARMATERLELALLVDRREKMRMRVTA